MSVNNDKISSQSAAIATSEKLCNQLPENLKQRESGLFFEFFYKRGNALTKIQALYEFVDELYRFIGRFVPCKKGCAHCCHIPVSVSELEVELIRKHVKVRRSKAPAPTANNDTPCPFLRKGVCSIYQVRPLFCRMHVTFDSSSEWCKGEKAYTINLKRIQFSEVLRVYNLLISEKGGIASIRDIREYTR